MHHRLLHLQALSYEARPSCVGMMIELFYLLVVIFGEKRSTALVSDCLNLEILNLHYFVVVNYPRSMKIRSIHLLTPYHHRRQQ